MSAFNEQSTLVGNFKERYASKIQALYKFMSPLCTEYFPFSAGATAIGNKYHQPVDLQLESGLSHSAGGTTPQVNGLTGFIAPIPGQMQDAQAVGGQIFGRAQVTYEADYRSRGGTEKAFVESVGWIVKRLSLAHMKRMEIFSLHGGRGLGTIDSTNAAAVGLTRAYKLTAASSSPGLWNGLLGSRIVEWLADYSALTSLAGNGTITASVTTLAFDAVTYQVTVTVTYNTSSGNTDLTTDFTGTQIFFETGGPGAEMWGIDAWSNVTAATASWFNIATTYDLWQSNQYPINGAARFQNIVQMCAIAQNYGILSGPLLCIVSPLVFANVMTEQAALRRYTAEKVDNEFMNGAKKLVFNTGAGEVELLAHPTQKVGLIHICCPDEGKRIGATDVTFITRGGGGEQLILESATAPASEMRSYSLTEMFFEAPRHLVVGTGVTG